MPIRLSDFDYDLPPERIAQEPAARRDDARLLVLDRSRAECEATIFRRIGSYLRRGDLLVLNDARVFPARLRSRRPTGGAVEVFLLGPIAGHPTHWRALIKPAKAGRGGDRLPLGGEPRACVVAREEEGAGRFQVEVLFDARPLGPEPMCAAEVLALCERIGEVPLPPYIERSSGDLRRAQDIERYQTVYARSPGAVAAPTAGLHFTPELLEDLRLRGIETASVTLTVGLGTFQPVREETLATGRLFPEPVDVPRASGERILAARREGRRIVAAGTTAVRALESWAAAGSPLEADGWRSETDLLIAPGHRFALVGALITNFHLPRSTLLLLVSALAGRDRVLDAYRQALDEGFRFYSYGDAMLIS